MHIFVSICSFRDPLLHHTVKSLIESKSKRHTATYAIFEQIKHSDSLENLYPELVNHPDVLYKRIEPQFSDGCVWARAVNLLSVTEKHDFIYQIDSHMVFDDDWDRFLVEDYKRARDDAGHDKVIITGSCLVFETNQDGQVHKRTWPQPMTTDVKYYMFDRYTGIPGAHGEPTLATEMPKPAFHILAGNFFTHREWIKNVGLIPESYFDCEEVLMTIMSYAAGYRMYHHTEVKCYHYHSTEAWPTKQFIDPVHSASKIQLAKDRSILYWKRYIENVREDVLNRFLIEFGVDFINLKIEDRARTTAMDGPDHIKTDDDLEFAKRKKEADIIIPPSEITVQLKAPKKKSGAKPMKVIAIAKINSTETNKELKNDAD